MIGTGGVHGTCASTNGFLSSREPSLVGLQQRAGNQRDDEDRRDGEGEDHLVPLGAADLGSGVAHCRLLCDRGRGGLVAGQPHVVAEV